MYKNKCGTDEFRSPEDLESSESFLQYMLKIHVENFWLPFYLRGSWEDHSYMACTYLSFVIHLLDFKNSFLMLVLSKTDPRVLLNFEMYDGSSLFLNSISFHHSQWATWVLGSPPNCHRYTKMFQKSVFRPKFNCMKKQSHCRTYPLAGTLSEN